MLKFSNGNRKMKELAEMLGLNKKRVVCFDLPAGYTCPMAVLCKTYANPASGKIIDGKEQVFRCYAASSEARFKNSRALHWDNYNTLKNSADMVSEINNAIPEKVKVIRIHSSGDFFSKEYFNAWVQVAIQNPDISFFGYTKVLEYVKAVKPDNFRLVYSYGGKNDNDVTDEPVAYVVNSVSDGLSRGLFVACQEQPSDDYYAVMRGQSFALALHGTQPAKH